MNAPKGRPQGQPASTPSLVGASKVSIHPAESERNAAATLLDSEFGQDFSWDCMGVVAGWFWLLAPIRPRLKALWHKYHGDVQEFQRRANQVFKSRLRSLERDPKARQDLAQFREHHRRATEAHNHIMGGSSQEHPEALPGKKLGALDDLFQLFLPALKGHPIEEDPQKVMKRFAADVNVLAERPAGAPPKEILDVAKELVDSGRYQGSRRSHKVALELERRLNAGELKLDKPDDPISRYSKLSDIEQDRQRRRIKEGLYRRTPETK